MNLSSDCKPELKTQGINCLDGELGGDRGEEAGTARLTCFERGGQCRFGLRQALAAAGSDPQVAGQIAQRGRPALDGGADLALRNGFAYAYDHAVIVNANANDCQYRIACLALVT